MHFINNMKAWSGGQVRKALSAKRSGEKRDAILDVLYGALTDQVSADPDGFSDTFITTIMTVLKA